MFSIYVSVYQTGHVYQTSSLGLVLKVGSGVRLTKIRCTSLRDHCECVRHNYKSHCILYCAEASSKLGSVLQIGAAPQKARGKSTFWHIEILTLGKKKH